MRKSLLGIVQTILSGIDSDQVNSIDDTVESRQIADIVRNTYENLMSERNWEHQRTLLQLDASTDPNRPNYMRVPSNIKEIVEIRYDTRRNFDDQLHFSKMTYMYPDDFLRYVSGRNSTLDWITVVTDFSGVQLLIRNNHAPTRYTSFDDDWVVFDSWNQNIEDTLQRAKSQCIAYVNNAYWRHDDAFIPDMPDQAFPVLIEQAKSTAFLELKQTANELAQRTADKHNRRMSRKNWHVHNVNRFPNYGRRGQK